VNFKSREEGGGIVAKKIINANQMVYVDEKNVIHLTTGCPKRVALVRPVFGDNLSNTFSSCKRCFPEGIAFPHSAYTLARQLFSSHNTPSK
jgi:hypothetical protein